MLKKLIEEKAQKQEEMNNLINTIEVEERTLTEDEEARFNALESEIKRINATIEKIEKGRELTKEEEKKVDEKEEESMNEEQRAIEQENNDIKAFANYIRNQVQERADSNLAIGDNGDIVPTTIAKKIITKVYDMSPILEKVTKYNTKGKLEIPVYGAKEDGTDITMAYSDDFQTLEAKVGQFKSVELSGFLAGALAKLGKRLINNTDIDLVNKVIEIMADTVKRFMEKELLVGTPNKVSGCSDITLKVTTEAPTVLTADDLVKLKNKVKQAFRKNSIFVMHQDTLTAVQLLKDGNDRFLFTEDLTGEFDGRILGYPVYVSDNMPTISAGSTPIIFGDFSGLALKQSEEIEIQVLREVYANQHAVGIVAWTEFDSKVEHLQKLAKLEMAEE